MKTSISITLGLATILIAQNAFSGETGGGGDLSRSSYTQIESALKWNSLSTVLSDLVIQTRPNSPIHLTDPKVIEAVKNMEKDPIVSQLISGKVFVGSPGDSSPVGITRTINLIKKYKGESCFQKDHDLSNQVTIGPDGVKKAEICAQMDRLTRVPYSALSSEVGAALVHELIEIAGMPHTTALYVQNYLLKHHDDFCIIQIAPSHSAQLAGQPDRYRVFLRDLRTGVQLKWGPRVVTEWLSVPYPNAPFSPGMDQDEEYRDLSRMISKPTSKNTSEDNIKATMHAQDASLNNFNLTKEKSSVNFQAIDREGVVHQLSGSWGKVVLSSSVFYTIAESERATIHFTLDGHPLDVSYLEFYSAEGCFPN